MLSDSFNSNIQPSIYFFITHKRTWLHGFTLDDSWLTDLRNDININLSLFSTIILKCSIKIDIASSRISYYVTDQYFKERATHITHSTFETA